MKANKVWKWRYPLALVGLMGLAGSAIAWDNGSWSWPYTGTISSANATAFSVTNSGTGTSVGISGSGGAYGVIGAGNTDGVKGTSSASGGYGVVGLSTATSGAGIGVQAVGYSGSGYGLWANNAATSGNAIGVYGTTSSAAGYGVYGENTVSNAGGAGVYGNTSGSSAAGVWGNSSSTNSNSQGVYGYGYTGVFGYGTGTSGYGVYGTGVTGVFGYGTSYGVYGNCPGSGTGVYGYSNSGYEGYFTGGTSNTGVYIGGNLNVTGSITAGTKDFKIDDPIDPANKYLTHTCVESPDMKNIYDGVAVLDANGKAWVKMPDYFQALNKDFRYQLTCIGQPSLVYIAKTIVNNRFQIAGGKAGMQVSWQVTGIRHDAFANAHRDPVEQYKPVSERGKYLYPVELGLSKTKGIAYQKEQRMAKRLAVARKQSALLQPAHTSPVPTVHATPAPTPRP